MKLKRPTTHGTLKRQVIRLVERDRQIISAGLSWIAANYRLRNEGQHAQASLERMRPDRFDIGVYQQAFMDGILALQTTLSSLSVPGRRRFDTSFEIAACAVAVRVALKRQRHGHIRLNIPRIDSVSKRLLRRLETARKRAKRAEIAREGLSGFQKKSRDWQEFVRWLRVHIPNCNCRRRRPTRWNRRRGYIDQLVGWAREELIQRKAKLPDDRELRRLVNLQLRYSRRGRTGFGMRDLLKDKGVASIRLATFITVRMEKNAKQEK